MIVAFVLDDTLDRPDGVQQMVLTFGEWLSNHGHEVHYIVSDTQRTDIPNIHSLGKVIRVQFNGNRMGTPLPTMKKVAEKVLEKIQPDILHVQMPYSPLMAGQVIRAAGKNTAIVGSFHILPQGPTSKAAAHLLNLISLRSSRRFDAMVGVSKEAENFCRSVYGRSNGVVHNPISIKEFSNRSLVADQNDTMPHIVFLGRMVVRKGCQHLIDALGELQDKHPDLKWRATIAGRGHMLEHLKKRAKKNGIDERVTFPGFISEEDKPALLSSADIAAFPSTSGESFGIILTEAMASGAGVVIGGNNLGYKTVLGGQPETLFDPKNTEKFAELLYTLITDKKLRSRLHGAQQKEVLKYDVDSVGNELVAVYQKVLKNR